MFRYDYEHGTHDQKYEVNLLRFRVNTLTDQNSRSHNKRVALRR